MPPRRNRSLQVLILAIAAVVIVVIFTDLPPWTLVVGGISLAVGAVALMPTTTGRATRATVGRVPALAPAFQPRPDIQKAILDARADGRDVVLHGPGGTGTTQLAVSAAQEAVRSGADLVVWVDATAPAAVITAFALAAFQVDAPGVTGADISVDAHTLLDWLQETDRQWLIVFDGVTDAALLDEWWPAEHSGTGWILATTTGPVTDPVFDRAVAVEVGPFTAAEAHEYFAECKLVTEDDDAAELAAELDHLPLALFRAAAYLRTERLACRDYLNRWIDRRKTVVDPAEAAVLLALDTARRSGPAGQALPVLQFAAVLDPAGQPAAVWKKAAVAGRGDVALRIVAALQRYGLVEYDYRLGAKAVRMHPGTAHVVKKNTTASVRDAAALTAADAVLDVWPDDDAYPGHAELVQALRANADALATLDGDPLWRPDPHELVWRAGISLDRAGLHAAAIGYWQRLADTGARLGRAEATLTALGRLAASHSDAGQTAAAVVSYERVVEGRTDLHGPGAAPTLDARESLALAYLADDRPDDALAVAERLVPAREELNGPAEEPTVKARWILATCYRRAGRSADAAAELELVVDGYAALRGPDHPDTQAVREILAAVRDEESD